MSEKHPEFEQSAVPEPAPESSSQERAPATFERASEALRELKALGIENPEFTDDERAHQFQQVLEQLDASSEHLPDTERNEYPARRALLFFNAGFADAHIIEEQLEFLEQNLADEENRGNAGEVDRIQLIIHKLEQLVPKSPEPEVPTIERIGEALRQPGRLPKEAHAMVLDWKAAKLAEVGTGAEARVDVEMQVAKLYADNGRPLDAIGSISFAIIDGKKMKPALKKVLEDFREELKRR